MTLDTAGKRRPAAAMPGYALALSGKHSEQDKRDAAAMLLFVALRAASVKPAARMRMLAGLLGAATGRRE